MKRVIALMTAVLFVLGISALSFAADPAKPEVKATKAVEDKAAKKATAEEKKAVDKTKAADDKAGKKAVADEKKAAKKKAAPKKATAEEKKAAEETAPKK